MFIETGVVHDPRSSGAQCFRQWYGSRASVSLGWSEEESFAPAFYKHSVTLGPLGALHKNYKTVGATYQNREW
jgi:hypothetical protein